MPQSTLAPVRTGAEAFVELLNANGVDYIFLNSGTDTFPIQEAIARFRSEGRPTPQVVVCPHEAVAMAAAHGHFMVSGRPQVVLVHVDIGTLQVGGALHNAQRGKAGIVLCAGRAPLTLEGELPGSRNLWIHWIQEQMDQGMIVRGLVKWDYELRRNESIHHVVNRAFAVAAAEPAGPVYLSLPREVLMAEMEGVPIGGEAERSLPITPQADPHALAQAGDALAKAQHPLIIVGRAGRNPTAVGPLVALAERLGAPVVASAYRLNFPTTHPLWAGTLPDAYLREADVILIVDEEVPYIPSRVKPRPDATIIWIDIDPVKPTIPLFTFPAHLRIHADSAKALPALVEAVDAVLTPTQRQRNLERLEALAQTHQQRREEVRRTAQRLAAACPIAPEWLVSCIDQVLAPEDLLLDETVTNAGLVAQGVARTLPGTLFTSGGSSLGWALGASIGAKLAAPDRRVVALVGDGSFLFGCPTSALWTATAYRAPFLTVIFNNQMHHATKRSWREAYPQSYAQRLGEWIGVDLTPSPDYALVAQACGAYGERVEDPAQVLPALRRGLEAVERGQPAVLDMRIQRP
ncbi:Benzoylformate decarboxylase [bacterium HR23]|nr:Benzoylformate decarboxylase [bacterium HR23]